MICIHKIHTEGFSKFHSIYILFSLILTPDKNYALYAKFNNSFFKIWIILCNTIYMTPHPNKYFNPIIKVWCVLWIPTVLVLYWYPQQDYPRLFLQTLELHWQNSRQRTLSGLWTNSLKGLLIYYYKQCLGSGSGSVGSARFLLPRSGSAKICGSTDISGSKGQHFFL